MSAIRTIPQRVKRLKQTVEILTKATKATSTIVLSLQALVLVRVSLKESRSTAKKQRILILILQKIRTAKTIIPTIALVKVTMAVSKVRRNKSWNNNGHLSRTTKVWLLSSETSFLTCIPKSSIKSKRDGGQLEDLLLKNPQQHLQRHKSRRSVRREKSNLLSQISCSKDTTSIILRLVHFTGITKARKIFHKLQPKMQEVQRHCASGLKP